MNTIFKLKPILFLAVIALFAIGCSSDDNDGITIDPTDPTSEFDGELSVFETGTDNRSVTINSSDVTTDNAKVKVSFATSTSTMRRLYVTQDVSGFGAEPYAISTTGVTVDDKKDGSLDLSSANGKAFDFQIDFPMPTTVDSQIVYTIWATTGRGDFRDISKRNAISDTALGTITINGTGTSNATGINSSTTTLELAAPLGDGSSETFLSVYNEKVYKISAGEETAALWDFGFYYFAVDGAGNEDGIALASTSSYPSLFGGGAPFVGVSGLTGVAQEDLNNFFFAKSSLTVADFDAVTTAADLNGIATPGSEKVTNLAKDDIVEFEDQYGNKGLLRVIDFNASNGSAGFISFDIKVQF